MEEYKNIRNNLIDFLKTARGEDYDAVYYYIGKYDFDQANPEALEAVADLTLEKATKGKKNPYLCERHLSIAGVLYNNAEDAPLDVTQNIERRQQVEEVVAKKKEITYIPNSPKFVSIVSAAFATTTQAEFEEMERRIQKSQTFSGQFTENLKRQISNPRDNIGVGWMILYAIVILWVILAIIY